MFFFFVCFRTIKEIYHFTQSVKISAAFSTRKYVLWFHSCSSLYHSVFASNHSYMFMRLRYFIINLSNKLFIILFICTIIQIILKKKLFSLFLTYLFVIIILNLEPKQTNKIIHLSWVTSFGKVEMQMNITREKKHYIGIYI